MQYVLRYIEDSLRKRIIGASNSCKGMCSFLKVSCLKLKKKKNNSQVSTVQVSAVYHLSLEDYFVVYYCRLLLNLFH